ncbi:hypothetical protein M758_5G054300 [Ceratodon purpureus]|nr:hypothetical protein M758_5G054300 [Ceratodon purpureus]
MLRKCRPRPAHALYTLPITKRMTKPHLGTPQWALSQPFQTQHQSQTIATYTLLLIIVTQIDRLQFRQKKILLCKFFRPPSQSSSHLISRGSPPTYP